MSKPNAASFLEVRQAEIATMISQRRLFKAELRKLRTLPAPNLSLGWWDRELRLAYSATLIDMRDSAKWLEKWMLFVPPESITSTDSPRDGTRTFACTYEKKGKKLILTLEVSIPDEVTASSKCRKVIIGYDTHNHTSTVPRYELVCD